MAKKSSTVKPVLTARERTRMIQQRLEAIRTYMNGDAIPLPKDVAKAQQVVAAWEQRERDARSTYEDSIRAAKREINSLLIRGDIETALRKLERLEYTTKK